MGRRKLSMKLIENEKERKLAMEKRKISLKKKAYELSTLCDVPVCIIMYNPHDRSNSDPPLLYPENRDEVQSIVDRYISGENCSKRRLNQENMVQGDVKKKRIGDSASIDCLNKDHLCDMASILDQKLQFVQNRIAEFGNYMNHGQVSGGFDPDFGSLLSRNYDQELEFCAANWQLQWHTSICPGSE